eukprot:CAMPEP_0202454718 /NCGR_PEP_ID=MMETSP1360-20130828/12381_1 /ASSEMBLY_ACC=CAM_ASM_000848 /TAXON_ID=515479 /ORGANISM="Licmophora paradoxa, Strain CCMP2313" /LENGTH=356 /DNA_ID=CAMNT_0049074107 /DNA_START=341 /DNA_END=1411 /DNA_ORIENTATION=-
MDTTHNLTLLINHIHCDHGTNEFPGTDEVFFRIKQWVNGDWSSDYSEHYHTNPIRMNKSGDFDDYNVNIEINVTYQEKILVELWECDKPNKGGNHKDKYDKKIGYWILDRDIEIENTTGKKLDWYIKSVDYELQWRVLSKPVPAVRVLGVYCYESSKGIDSEVCDDICAAAEKACEIASDELKESKRPKAKAMSKAFGKAAEYMDAIDAVIKWIADVAEGDDEVYLQNVDEDTAAIEGGGFWPTESPGYQKMNKGDEVYFTSNADETEEKTYYRFPLDRGAVSIQFQEHDPTKSNEMGLFTFDTEYYNKYADQGSQCLLCDKAFYNGDNQGAVYYLVASVGMEDFAKSARVSEQEA